ncbi:MAG: hypothetical protein H7251_00230 [Acetobacteraceae bacterium]|nr:hypothetical protein [Acetobacteraceae bacterium]
MEDDISGVIVGALVAVLGMVGLIMASGAYDNAIFIFGLSLAAFAVLFNIGLIRRHFDRRSGGRHV